jgi:DNA-binding response OmpR family regulator
MPKLTGSELAREIHKIRPGIPIIMCTGFSENVAPSTAIECGVEILTKPFVSKDLADSVRVTLDRSRLKS